MYIKMGRIRRRGIRKASLNTQVLNSIKQSEPRGRLPR